MNEDLRAKSRRVWVSEKDSLEMINTGIMLRIADATEKMAQRYTELLDSRESYKRMFASLEQDYALLDRRLSAAKGQITKLKKRLAEAKS